MKTKNFILLILGLTISLSTFAQLQTVKSYWDWNKTILHEIYTVKANTGIKHGTYKEYDQNGNLILSCTFIDNKLNGAYISNNYDEKDISNYKNGVLDGIQKILDPSGKTLLKLIIWRNGKEIESTEYNKNVYTGEYYKYLHRKLIPKELIPDNQKSTWDQFAIIKYYSDGKMMSYDSLFVSKTYYENGQLSESRDEFGSKNYSKEGVITKESLKIGEQRLYKSGVLNQYSSYTKDRLEFVTTDYDSIGKPYKVTRNMISPKSIQDTKQIVSTYYPSGLNSSLDTVLANGLTKHIEFYESPNVPKVYCEKNGNEASWNHVVQVDQKGDTIYEMTQEYEIWSENKKVTKQKFGYFRSFHTIIEQFKDEKLVNISIVCRKTAHELSFSAEQNITRTCDRERYVICSNNIKLMVIDGDGNIKEYFVNGNLKSENRYNSSGDLIWFKRYNGQGNIVEFHDGVHIVYFMEKGKTYKKVDNGIAEKISKEDFDIALQRINMIW